MSDLPAGLRVQKVGELVELSGRITLAEGADDWILLFTLPEEYRPGGIVPCGVESEGGVLELWIEPDGSVLADSLRPGWIEPDGINYPAGG